MGILFEAKIEGISEVQGVKNYDGKLEGAKVKVLGPTMKVIIPPQSSKLTWEVKASKTSSVFQGNQNRIE